MNQLKLSSLSILLSLSALGGLSFSATAQEIPVELEVNLNQEINTQTLEINTIQQQATGQPTPGTSSTTANSLISPQNQVVAQSMVNSLPTQIAQNTTDPEIIFRHDYSYIGLGGNVGVKLEQTSLGEAAFVINSKIALAQELSLRPAVLFSENDTIFVVPITYDITLKDKDPFKEVPYVPFIGGGAVFTTNDNDNAGFLITGGLDYRLSRDFVANISLHTGFIEDSTDMGLVIGVGYIIPQKDR